MQYDHGRNGHQETCWVGWKAISWVCWHRNWCTRWHPITSNRSPCVHGGGCEWKLEGPNCLFFHWWPQWKWPGESNHTVSVPPLWHRCHCDIDHLWWGIKQLGHVSWTWRIHRPQRTSVPHPSYNAHKIHIFLDVCLMLKLVRNTLASQTLIDGDGKHIKWQYIEELHKLQEGEGLRAANKLRTPHIEWQRQKMKVNLAAQVISNSVGNALELCLALNLPQFKGCEATVVFFKTFDSLFDILNLRNPLAKNFKAPMTLHNQHLWKYFFDQITQYIYKLKHFRHFNDIY